jgi:hypothetical protein
VEGAKMIGLGIALAGPKQLAGLHSGKVDVDACACSLRAVTEPLACIRHPSIFFACIIYFYGLITSKGRQVYHLKNYTPLNFASKYFKHPTNQRSESWRFPSFQEHWHVL